MSEILVDGTGKGYRAKIDSENKIWTRATTIPEATHISVNDKNYYILCNGSGHDTGTAGWRLHLKNTDPDNLILIQEVHVSSDGDGFWHMGKGGVPSSGTDIDPISLYFSSEGVPTVDAKYDSAMTFTTNPSRFTGGRYAVSCGKYIEKYDGAMVLDSGDSLQLYWRADEAGKIISFGLQFFIYNKSLLT